MSVGTYIILEVILKRDATGKRGLPHLLVSWGDQ